MHYAKEFFELQYERFNVISHKAQWSKNAMPGIVKSRKDWEHKERNLSNEAKWHNTQCLCDKLSAKQQRRERSPSRTAVPGVQACAER